MSTCPRLHDTPMGPKGSTSLEGEGEEEGEGERGEKDRVKF